MPSCVLALRVAGEHLDHIVVQAVVELALKRPGKLRLLDFARQQQKLVGGHSIPGGLKRISTATPFGAVGGLKVEKRVLVSGKLATNAFKEIVGGSGRAVQEIAARAQADSAGCGSASSPRSFISPMAFSNAASALASKSTK